MPNLNKRALILNSIYYIMSEQPNCCPHCQFRLDIIETILIGIEEIQVNYCYKCNCEVLMVEEDVT